MLHWIEIRLRSMVSFYSEDPTRPFSVLRAIVMLDYTRNATCLSQRKPELSLSHIPAFFFHVPRLGKSRLGSV